MPTIELMRTRRFIGLSLILILLPLANSYAAATYNVYQPSEFQKPSKTVLFSWNSPEGKKRFFRSRHKDDFFQLAHHYQPQANPLYCGVATSVIVLNALRVSKGNIPSQEPLSIQTPKVWGGQKIGYPLYSQATFFNDKTDQVKDRKIIRLENTGPEHEKSDKGLDPGFMLDQLKATLETYDLTVQATHVDNLKDMTTFRKMTKDIVRDDTRFLVINYQSKSVGQAGGGHISPIAAYDEISDSVLVLDTSAYLNPWVWIPLSDLYMAMNTKDGNQYRGYLVISDSK